MFAIYGKDVVLYEYIRVNYVQYVKVYINAKEGTIYSMRK